MSITCSLLDDDLYTYEYFLQDDVCRFCWNRNADQAISSKTKGKDVEKNPMLYYKIQECLNIDLCEENWPNYPRKACTDCCTKIENFHNFKHFCQETDRKLYEIFKSHNNNSTTEPQVPNSNVKIEKIDQFPNLDLSRTDSFDSFLDSLQNSDHDYMSQEDCKPVKKNLKTSKYKHKRTSTYCNICHIDLKTEDKYRLHNSKSHGVENNDQFKCFGCEKRFKSRKTRLGHEINFCKGLKDGYRCEICLRFLPKRRMYEAHMKDHRENENVELPDDLFKCIKCFKLFKSKEKLKCHMIVHDGEKKNFVCESCGRVFSRQDYLYKHKLTHTGIKEHVCPHCGFRAAQRSSLTVHIRKHTGERPYSCDMCPQRCVSSSNLRAHRRRHLGVKQYECKICSKKFGYKISLEEHVANTHERSQIHTCQICGTTYSRIRGLRRHLLAKHGTKIKKIGKNVRILEQNELVSEQNGQILEQNGQISEQNGQVLEQNGQISEQNGQMSEQNGQISEQNGQILEQNGHNLEQNGQSLTVDLQFQS